MIVVLTNIPGGLGVKDLQAWNKACCLHLIWLLMFRPDSVWVSWFKEVILKVLVHNYWTIKPSQSFSWLAKNLLKLKNVVFPLIQLRMQNGHSRRFWFDNWSLFGCLHDFMGATTSRLGIPLFAPIASIHSNGSWNLPSPRLETQLQLLSHNTTIRLNSKHDYYEWKVHEEASQRFQTGAIYNYLCGHITDVSWSLTIWISRGILRHLFQFWLVV